MTQALMQWLREQGMVDHPPHTHLVMPRGPFLSVPVNARTAFHEKFEAEWGTNHISELGRPNAFQLFFDIDGLSLAELLQALPALHEILGATLFVTGVDGPPPGYHVFAPGHIVDSAKALSLRQKWIDLVPELQGYVDGQLYQSPQLRLLGSRKISKDGVDTGRVHEFVGVFDGRWHHEAVQWDWSQVSIHPPHMTYSKLSSDPLAVAGVDF